MLQVITRPEWRAPPTRLIQMPVPVRFTWIHHTASAPDADEAREMRKLEDFHRMQRNMAAIAYSFVIFPSGKVYEGRGWGKLGGHTLNYNSTSHGIAFAGNFEIDQPSAASLMACVSLIRDGVRLGKIQGNLVQPTGGHRDTGFDTACPGDHLQNRLPWIRSTVRHGAPETEGDDLVPISDADAVKFKTAVLSALVDSGVVGTLQNIQKALDKIAAKP